MSVLLITLNLALFGISMLAGIESAVSQQYGFVVVFFVLAFASLWNIDGIFVEMRKYDNNNKKEELKDD